MVAGPCWIVGRIGNLNLEKATMMQGPQSVRNLAEMVYEHAINHLESVESGQRVSYYYFAKDDIVKFTVLDRSIEYAEHLILCASQTQLGEYRNCRDLCVETIAIAVGGAIDIGLEGERPSDHTEIEELR